MENAYVYFTVIISISALSAALLYDPENRSGFKFALGIILMAALFDPAVTAIKGLSSLEFDYTGTAFESEALSSTLEEGFLDGVRRMIADEFSIKEKNIELKARGFDPENMRAEEISVTLVGIAMTEDVLAIEKFVSELGLGKCTLEVRVG